MKNAPAVYITTTLPYVNADPHIGFALEIVQADVLARYNRLLGKQVFFNTGTDEHGQKIYEVATAAGRDIEEYVNYYAGEFRKLQGLLALSNDRFIRTTDDAHVAAAIEMWRRCDAAGDIYKRQFEGLYCVGCEKYLTERDMENGVCSIHGKAPERLQEENYFFRFSKYGPALLEYLKKENSVVPEWRREEAMAFVSSGLEDFSISREKAKLSWGIPVPGDDNQVMYVWFDALTNYISTLGWGAPSAGDAPDFESYWQNGFTIQMAGKDQVRFQSLMWQAMLMSAGVKNTDQIFYHGFITSGGKKMSKSLGNVISPFDLVQKYGTDATRYLLLRHVHPFEDTDVTWPLLDEWYNTGLANGLGNLVSRVMKMATTYIDEAVPVSQGHAHVCHGLEALESYDFKKAADHVWEKIASLDKRIQETEPFKLYKTEPEKAREMVRELVAGVYEVGEMLAVFMPDTSRKIMQAVEAHTKPDNLFSRIDS